MDVQGNPISSNQNINDPSNAAQNENDDYVFYVEDSKYSKSNLFKFQSLQVFYFIVLNKTELIIKWQKKVLIKLVS